MARCLAGIGAVTLCVLSSDDPDATASTTPSHHRAVTAVPPAANANANTNTNALPAADDLMHLIDPASALPHNVLTRDMLPRSAVERFLSLLVAPPAPSFRRAAADNDADADAAADASSVTTGTGTGTTGATASMATTANPAAPTAPLLWVHVPQSGAAFLQTLLWTVCASWPRDWSLLDYTGKSMAEHFERYSPASHCPDGMAEAEGGRPDFHGGLGVETQQQEEEDAATTPYAAHKGHLVAMFRRPDERIVHSFGAGNATDLAEYRQRAAGCITKTLSRGGTYPCVESDVPPTEGEVALAIQRLREGFAFVGLTEEWNLSICLWHATVGGTPYAEEFQAYRPVVVGQPRLSLSAERRVEEVEEAEEEQLRAEKEQSGEYYDRADEAVYRAAEEVFWSNVDKAGMTAERCKEMIETAASRADLPPDDETEDAEDEVDEDDTDETGGTTANADDKVP
jgi:hypothetical protein